MNIQPHLARRAALLAQMGEGIAVICTAPEVLRNRDTHYRYRFDSYFYYLTGFAEPESILVLIAGANPKSIFFCRDKDIEREIWDGYRHGPQAAADTFGFDEAFGISEFDTRFAELLANQPVLFHSIGFDATFDARISAALNRVRANARAGAHTPSDIRDIRALLDEMRLIKDEHEISLMRRAAEISCTAHRRAMRAAAPGVFEYAIEAELMHEFLRQGAQAPAYSPIVAGGERACVLHYIDNRAALEAGELLLIDAGCELDGYASDITRTFPVSGTFSGPQREIYQLVLAAQHAAIAATTPGTPWDAPHQAAVRLLAQGMIDLKLIPGTLEGALESGAYKRFYMHRTGHWLGLDVHDAGEYKRRGIWRELQPGMTLTIEPGCYIRAAPDVPEAFWNIGVRIEDDVLVTPGGCEILTAAAPKTVADIEALMARA